MDTMERMGQGKGEPMYRGRAAPRSRDLKARQEQPPLLRDMGHRLQDHMAEVIHRA